MVSPSALVRVWVLRIPLRKSGNVCKIAPALVKKSVLIVAIIIHVILKATWAQAHCRVGRNVVECQSSFFPLGHWDQVFCLFYALKLNQSTRNYFLLEEDFFITIG